MSCAGVTLRTRFVVFADHGAHSRRVVNTRPIASLDARLRLHDRRLRAPRSASEDKTRRRLYRHSPSSIERCLFAHEAVDDEPTPAFCRGVELGAGSEGATGRRGNFCAMENASHKDCLRDLHAFVVRRCVFSELAVLSRPDRCGQGADPAARAPVRGAAAEQPRGQARSDRDTDNGSPGRSRQASRLTAA
jgi:hypothetical protein